MALSLSGVAVGYQGVPLLRDVTVEAPRGSVLCLLGRNGVGKTTLFKSILRLLPLIDGTIRVGGASVSAMKRGDLARQIAYVPQNAEESFGYKVSDVVMLGRAAWLGWYGVPEAADHAIVREVLERLDIGHLADSDFMKLSGGQRQMVLIARALAQQPSVLMMDEPTANLDLGNEARVLRATRDLAASGITVVFTTHRPEHAYAIADRAVLLMPGGRYEVGDVDQVLTPEAMHEAFAVEVALLEASAPDGSRLRSCVPVL